MTIFAISRGTVRRNYGPEVFETFVLVLLCCPVGSPRFQPFYHRAEIPLADCGVQLSPVSKTYP